MRPNLIKRKYLSLQVQFLGSGSKACQDYDFPFFSTTISKFSAACSAVQILYLLRSDNPRQMAACQKPLPYVIPFYIRKPCRQECWQQPVTPIGDREEVWCLINDVGPFCHTQEPKSPDRDWYLSEWTPLRPCSAPTRWNVIQTVMSGTAAMGAQPKVTHNAGQVTASRSTEPSVTVLRVLPLEQQVTSDSLECLHITSGT